MAITFDTPPVEPSPRAPVHDATLGQGQAGPTAPAGDPGALLYLFQTTAPTPGRNAVAKKAETLFLNLEGMLKRRGIEGIAFMTLTFKQNMTCRREAQRHFHSFATHFLYHEIPEFVAVVERQARGAIHYHIVAALGVDIRSGFDFESCSAANRAGRNGDVQEQRRLQALYFASANPALRRWWARVGNSKHPGAAQRHGFGRCETLPILSNAEALARYVGSYVGSEFSAREPRDKGLRTIRYSLEQRVASIRWSWATGNGRLWRLGCAVLSGIIGTDDLSSALGKNWPWHWRKEIPAFGRNFDSCMAVVNECLSDQKDFVERVAAASRLAGVLFDIEARNKLPGQVLA